MNNPFENKAIKFATEEELNHLAELAKSYGLRVGGVAFESGRYRHFRINMLKYYTNCYNEQPPLPEITYSDFIASLESTEQTPDMVNRPEHYRKCSIEPIQIWRELSLNGFMGDALKYLMRLGHKDSKSKELTKCIQYLTWEIENIELGIMQFTPKDAKCSVSADVIAKELGMSPFIHVALWVVLNLHTVEDKVNALNTAINSIRFEIDKTETI